MTKAATKPVAATAVKATAVVAEKPAAEDAKPVQAEPNSPVQAEPVEALTNPSTGSARTEDTDGNDVTDAIWVRTKQGVARRCRAGMVFTAVPVSLPVDDLTQEQLDAIEADPLLEAVDAPTTKAAETKAE